MPALPAERVPGELGRHHNVGHADLVSVVQDQRSWQGTEHQQRELDLRLIAAAPSAGEAAYIMVGRGPDGAAAGGPGRPRAGHARRETGPAEDREAHRAVES